MKQACFFIVFISILFCNTVQGQSVNNSEFPHKKTNTSVIPPQISSPSNNSNVPVASPEFIWTPPQPSGTGVITYNILMVQVQKGQTPAEALLQNPPLLSLSGLTNTFLSYPVDAPALQPNAQYAVQVAASSAGQNLGESDITTFNTNKKVENNDINYPVATKVSKEKFYLSHGVFHFVYNNMTNEKTLSYTMKVMDEKMQTINGLPVIKLSPGMNKLQVDLKQSSKLKNGSYYYLEITDKNKQVYKITYYYTES